jgi:putative heme-binding domain-containing protein
VGPDGAIFVADWFDPIVGGHQMQDAKGYGRIYRIAPKGRKLTTPAVDLNTLEGQIRALASPAVNVRAGGFARLRASGGAALPAVEKLLADSNPFLRARAIWLLAGLGAEGVRVVERHLTDADPQIRVAAFRALRSVKASVLSEAGVLARDASPAVRREVALAMRGTPFSQSRDILMALAAAFDGKDRWYLEALGTGADGNESALYSALLSSLPARGPLDWNERFAAVAWRLHPVASVDAFAARAAASQLPAEARQQALVALGFINDASAARAMATLTRSPLRDVAAQAAWWMTYRKTNDWHSYPVEGWTATVADAIPSASDAMVKHRALVLEDGAPVDRRIDAALAMAADPAGAQFLIQLAAQNKLAYQLREAVGSVIFNNADRSVRSAAAGYFARPGGRPRMTTADVASRTGDAARGEGRFLASCSTCHRRGAAGPGADVGPDLAAIRDKFDRAGLIDAVVNPSAAIAFGFGAELFATHKDETIIGFLQSEGATISIRDGYGRVRTVAMDALSARLPLKTSLMPEPLALALTEQDVADIVSFLMGVR